MKYIDTIKNIYELGISYTSHKNSCDRVLVSSTKKCSCGYEDKKSYLRDVPSLISFMGNEDFFDGDHIGFMFDKESGSIFLVDRREYDDFVSTGNLKNLRRKDVTGSIKLIHKEWLKGSLD